MGEPNLDRIKAHLEAANRAIVEICEHGLREWARAFEALVQAIRDSEAAEPDFDDGMHVAMDNALAPDGSEFRPRLLRERSP